MIGTYAGLVRTKDRGKQPAMYVAGRTGPWDVQSFEYKEIEKAKEDSMLFTVEVVWNREFNWRPWMSDCSTLEKAIAEAEAILNSGDGARVKKARVVDIDGKVRWQK